MNKLLRVCYFGTYREKYARNQILMSGLRQLGVEVLECHEPLWHGDRDRLNVAQGGWASLGFIKRVILTYWKLLQKYRHVGDYDVLVVGYPGHYDVFLARWLSWFRRKPLVWDVLNSFYLIVMERGMAQSHRFTVSLIYFLEGIALRLPNILLLDNPLFIDWVCQTYKLPSKRFRCVPIGADDRVFTTGNETTQTYFPTEKKQLFTVLYYGTYIPNHGVRFIVEAARILGNDLEIHFDLVGDGPGRANVMKLVEEYRLTNITFIDWLEHPALIQKITQADVCLGGFGDTLQSTITYNNKIHEAFALAKPVISGDSPATPKILRHEEHLYLCQRGNPEALAQAIRTLKSQPDLMQRLAEKGNLLFKQNFTVAHIGEIFFRYLEEIALL